MKKPRAIPDHIKAGILGNVGQLPNLADIVEHFILLCGGKKAFAEMLFNEYKSAPSGGLVRARTIELLIRMLDRLGGLTESEELGLISNEDLEAALVNKLQVVENVAQSGAAQAS